MAMAKTNVNWGELSCSNTLPQICKTWFEQSKTVILYNQHEKGKKFEHQPRGTAVVSRGYLALQVESTHYNNRRLGRWASQVF